MEGSGRPEPSSRGSWQAWQPPSGPGLRLIPSPAGGSLGLAARCPAGPSVPTGHSSRPLLHSYWLTVPFPALNTPTVLCLMNAAHASLALASGSGLCIDWQLH